MSREDPELILIVEDNERNLRLVRDLLQASEFATIEAQTARTGLALARSAQPDVILLDLVMPEVDGFAVVEQLRSDPRTSSIPIVVLTSKTLTTEDERRLRGRIASLARKGELDRHALLELLDRCILVKAP